MTGENRRGVHKLEHGRVERGGGEKKRGNPPIGAIKDRLIGGFDGKNKSQTSKTASSIKAGDWAVAASRSMLSVCCNRSRKLASNTSRESPGR